MRGGEIRGEKERRGEEGDEDERRGEEKRQGNERRLEERRKEEERRAAPDEVVATAGHWQITAELWTFGALDLWSSGPSGNPGAACLQLLSNMSFLPAEGSTPGPVQSTLALNRPVSAYGLWRRELPSAWGPRWGGGQPIPVSLLHLSIFFPS